MSMAWWSWLFPTSAGATLNANPPSSVSPNWNPGDEHGVTVDPVPGNVETRMATIIPSGWDGWPASWAAPAWGSNSQLEEMVDTVWAALDLNSMVTSSMPIYRLDKESEILPPTSWMTNPDPSIYASWAEFLKQLMWDYQLGEAFVLPMARGSDGFPLQFRVVPPHLINAEMGVGRRVYSLGQTDVTDDILHIRYKSTTMSARGQGPLESGRLRLLGAATLARYASEVAEGGAVPKYVLEVEQRMNKAQSDELLEQWWASRMANLGQPWKPAVLSGGAKAKPLEFSPQEMTLTDLSKWFESRISVLLGVPPFLLGLPSGGDSMTYKNVESIFDYHDRAGLHPRVVHVMQALSGWALPRGQSVELNRDEYTRPPLADRAEAYSKLVPLGVVEVPEARTMERLHNPDPEANAAAELTGGT